MHSCLQASLRPAPVPRATRSAIHHNPRLLCSRSVQAAAHNVDSLSKRLLLAGFVGLGFTGIVRPDAAHAALIEITKEVVGDGTVQAAPGDLLLVHYTGRIRSTGQIFDTTQGIGLTYRDGGEGVLRPAMIKLGGDPVPGVCKGLKAGLTGMRVGGKRSFVVPPELGFSGTVNAPYASVAAGSELEYEVTLLRLSRRGPDELTKGIDRCGQGGASAQTSNCANITPAEFL